MIKNILINIKLFIEKKINNYSIKKNNIKIGDNYNINGIVYIRNQGKITIGNNITINSKKHANPIGGDIECKIVVCKNAKLIIGNNVGISNSAIWCSEKILIEDNVKIGGGCRIWDTDFHSIDPEIRKSTDDHIKTAPVIIKENAFIGGGSIILKGVVIGKNSIIAAGSVLTKKVPDNEIWGGNPAKFIRKIEC